MTPFDAMEHEVLEWYHASFPVAASLNGWPGQDRRFQDLSEEGFRRRADEAGRLLRELHAVSAADEAQRVDLELMEGWLRRVERQDAMARQFVLNPSRPVAQAIFGVGILLLRAHGGDKGARSSLKARLEGIDGLLSQAMEELQVDLAAFPLVQRALRLCEAAAQMLEKSVPQFAADLPPATREGLLVAADSALLAVSRFAEYVTAAMEEASASPAVRQLTYQQMLYEEHGQVLAPKTLFREARQEVDRLQAKLGGGGKAPAGEVRVEALAAAVEKAQAAGVALMPPDAGPVQVGLQPAGLQTLLGRAVYVPSTGAGHASRIFVSPEEDGGGSSAQALAAMLAVPGQHLQAVWAQSGDDRVRRYLTWPIATAGWRQWSLELAAHLGGDDGSRQHLSEQLRAAALAVADVGVHTAGWGVTQAVSYLERKGLWSREAAESAVLSCLSDPVSGALPFLGARAFRALFASIGTDEGAVRRVLSLGPLPAVFVKRLLSAPA